MRRRAIRWMVPDVSMDRGALSSHHDPSQGLEPLIRRYGVTSQKLQSFKEQIRGGQFSAILRPQFSTANFGRNTSHPEAFRGFPQYLY